MIYDKPISYSGLSLYKKCPKSWAHSYIHGFRSPPGKAAMRGTMLHQKLEDYFNDGMWPEDITLRPWRDFMYDLATKFPMPEEKLAVDAEWNTTSFDDPLAHIRGAVDLSYIEDGVLYIKDWKSGGIYPAHEGQADIYACLGLATYPDCKEVKAEMVYLDAPKQTREWCYTPQRVQDLMGAIDHEVSILRADEEYAPTPSQEGCKWCPLSWRNGGACDKSP